MPVSTMKPNPPAPNKYFPPDYPLYPLHIAFILTDLFGKVPPLVLTPVWLALAAVACWAWPTMRWPVAALSLVFTISDWVGLALLPRLGRSFGPISPPLLALTLGRTALIFVTGLFWPTWYGLLFWGALNVLISTVFLYATWVEPFRIGVTHAELRSPRLKGQAPLRLLHITDLHVEHITRREQALLRQVEALDPDIMVITGDYLNLSFVHDAHAQAEAHTVLERLCEVTRGPIYTVTGSPPVDFQGVVPAIFEDLPITWLSDTVEHINLNGHAIQIAGLRCTRERHLDAPRLLRLLNNRVEHEFTLLLYHSPDLMPEAVEMNVDLYLCGHTHGGQVRLPLFGAVITSSHFWKQYEMGRYEEGNTTLYVSRGLGMEGYGAPRARFLAPPEIVLWTLGPTSGSTSAPC